LCQYNRQLFPSELILDVIRTHPMVIYRGVVCRNMYYVPPDELLGPGQAEREVKRTQISLLIRIKDHLRPDQQARLQEIRRKAGVK